MYEHQRVSNRKAHYTVISYIAVHFFIKSQKRKNTGWLLAVLLMIPVVPFWKYGY